MFARDLVRHEAEEHVPVGHGQGVGMLEIDFKLANAVLMVERVDIPSQMVHRFDEFEEPAAVVQAACHVVSCFGEVVARRHRAEADGFVVAEYIEFSLDSEVGDVAHVVSHREGAL